MQRLLTRLGTLALLSAVAGGCARPALDRGPYGVLRPAAHAGASAVPEITQREWTLSRERLAHVRAEQPDRPYVERVKLAIRDPSTGKRYIARGAVAVSPDRAARMMLVGPGGATALDVWVTKDRFRFEVPAMHYTKRGGAGADEAKGLPVGLLRWWFLSPLGGKLLVARSSRGESAWLLRDRDATVTVRSDGRRFYAIRREGERMEGIAWQGAPGLVPAAGARGLYIDGSYGLRVEVLVEDVLASEPDPEAFVDPDASKGMDL